MNEPLHLDITHGRASMNGEPVVVPDGTEPTAALIAHAQQYAVRVGGALAHLSDTEGSDTWLRIGPDGSLVETSAPAEGAPAAGSSAAPMSVLSGWNTTPHRSSTTATAPRPRPQVSRRAALIGAGGLMGTLIMGGGLWAALEDDDKPAPARGPATSNPASVNLPDGQYPPQGWSDTARWQLEGVSDMRPVVALRDGRAVVVTRPAGTGNLRVQAFTPETGHPTWHTDLAPSAVITDGPFLLNINGRLVTLIVTEDDIRRWDARTGQQIARDKLPKHAGSVGVSPLGPWANDKGQTFRAITSRGFDSFTVPKDASPYGVVDDAMLALDSHGHAWKITSGKDAGQGTHLPGPKGASAGAISVVTDTLIAVAWSQGRQTQLRAYDTHTLEETWTTRPETNWAAFLGTTQVSPDQTWATVDNRRIDLRTGATSVIAAHWKPTAISDTYAWGDDGRFILSCDRDGHLGPTPTHESTSTLVISGGGHDLALLTGSVANQNTLYGVARN